MIFARPFAAPGPAAARGPLAAAPALPVLAPGALVTLLSAGLAAGILPAEARREREIPLELVSVTGGTTPPHLTAHEVVVHVGRGGRIRMGGSDLSVEAFKARLEGLAAGAGEASITVRADAGAPYEVVARVLAASRRAGIRRASLLTVERAPGAEAPEAGARAK